MTNEDTIKTTLFTKAKWLRPVATVADLPANGVAEGTRCFVDVDGTDDDEEVWEFTEGQWIRRLML